MKTTALILLASATLLAASHAAAARPESLAATTWTLQTHRDAVQLVITHQGGEGAPGAATCRHIMGTIGIAPMRGWYCPSTGRVQFLHKNLSSGLTMRTFSGHVSEDVVGQPLYMAGTMSVMDAAFGALGDYNFSAVR